MEINNNPISASDLVDILCADSIMRNVKLYGLEGLEETIKKVYSQNPEIKERMLKIYKRMYYE
jgi:hypothetical protein